jgi:hypothetical protein
MFRIITLDSKLLKVAPNTRESLEHHLQGIFLFGGAIQDICPSTQQPNIYGILILLLIQTHEIQ